MAGTEPEVSWLGWRTSRARRSIGCTTQKIWVFLYTESQAAFRGMAQSPTLYPGFNETSLIWTGGGGFQDREGEDAVENAAGERCHNIY